MSYFDRDAKLAKAVYIFQEQEKRNQEEKDRLRSCKEKIEAEFLNYLPIQRKHEGEVTQEQMADWLYKHDDCTQFRYFEYSPVFPTETLEGKLSYDYRRFSFSWKLKN